MVKLVSEGYVRFWSTVPLGASQATYGMGLPSAMHDNVMLAPWTKSLLSETKTILAGTEIQNKTQSISAKVSLHEK